ncbi:STM4014 family protein [Catellatospora sp. KI3]|uniref:STM4014 family protein n=1 Tax=Catellatospora sp. KI3 TaxID=3041620 RepID=UPI0024828016|nr:STM4014 family protein [Catellatospora sp. KI3]MDI1463860.1 STM4014 family protein [Catellatospora sp. KI3]
MTTTASSPYRSELRLAVVGNPGNRRVRLFLDAVRAAGLPAPHVVPWQAVAAGAPFGFPAGALVRIDSPGEDAEVDRLLRGAPRPARHGEIIGLRTWYHGFNRALARVADVAARDGAALLHDPAEIAVLFDKSRCHALLSAAGVAVPPALPVPALTAAAPALPVPALTAAVAPALPVPALTPAAAPALPVRAPVAAFAPDGAEAGPGAAVAVGERGPRVVGAWDGLRGAMRDAGWHRVFVKTRHGSSSSGVLALQVAGARCQAVTSVELAADGLFNSLRVRTYTDERDVAAIVERLAPEGLHVERWFPKIGFAGRTIDLRVLVIGGRPAHTVVRASRHPMTNLHLGGVRGDLDAVRTAAGPHWEAAMDSCARAAACFPGSPHVGVDLMFGPGWRRHAIAEVNAFGDLLPNLLHDGRDTYAAQLAALAAGTPSSPAVHTAYGVATSQVV